VTVRNHRGRVVALTRILDAVCVANHGRPHRCRDAGADRAANYGH